MTRGGARGEERLHTSSRSPAARILDRPQTTLIAATSLVRCLRSVTGRPVSA